MPWNSPSLDIMTLTGLSRHYRHSDLGDMSLKIDLQQVVKTGSGTGKILLWFPFIDIREKPVLPRTGSRWHVKPVITWTTTGTAVDRVKHKPSSQCAGCLPTPTMQTSQMVRTSHPIYPKNKHIWHLKTSLAFVLLFFYYLSKWFTAKPTTLFHVQEIRVILIGGNRNRNTWNKSVKGPDLKLQPFTL